MRQAGIVEVEVLNLTGRIEKTEKMADEWHKQNVGDRVVGVVNLSLLRGLPKGTYFKVVSRFPNPYNPEDPVMLEDWPVNEEGVAHVHVGQEVTERFFGFEGAVYRSGWGGDGKVTSEYLYGQTESAEPLIEVEEIRVRKSSEGE